MNTILRRPRIRSVVRILIQLIILTLLGTSAPISTPVYARADLGMPTPGTRVTISPNQTPPLMKGVMLKADQPFEFDFLIDTGDQHLSDDQFAHESERLIKYFLASLAVPEQDLWVNLSPYEKDQTIPTTFGITEMGRDLLAQDYLLKQLTASLMYPEDETGQRFWNRVYKIAQQRYGTTEIPLHTFNKVWIIPEEAVVFERDNAAFVVKTRLKVMLEEEYVRLKEEKTNRSLGIQDTREVSQVTAEVVREVLIPEIEKEVNEGAHFSRLRQVYHSLILASWYKQAIKRSLINQIYTNQNKVTGVDVEDRAVKEKIYEQYLAAFQKGVYDYIREDLDPVTQVSIPRKYFSGGFGLVATPNIIERTTDGRDFAMTGEARIVTATFDPIGQTNLIDTATDQSMLVRPAQRLMTGGAGATFRTRLSQALFDLVPQMNFGHHLRIRDTVVGGPQLTKDHRPFDTHHTPLRQIKRKLGVDIVDHIVALHKARQSHPDEKVRNKPITVLDWGAGKGTALREIRRQLRLQGIGDVRLIGLSDDAYPEWKSLPLGIEMILDKGGRIDSYVAKGEIDFVYSYFGLWHFRMSRAYFSKLSKLMAPGAQLIFNHQGNISVRDFSRSFDENGSFDEVLRLRKPVPEGQTDHAMLSRRVITLDETRLPQKTRAGTKAGVRAAIRYMNEVIIAGRTGKDIDEITDEHYQNLLQRLGLNANKRQKHMDGRHAAVMGRLSGVERNPRTLGVSAFQIYLELGHSNQEGYLGYRRMGWLLMNYFLIRNGHQPLYLDQNEVMELQRVTDHVRRGGDFALFAEDNFAFREWEWSDPVQRKRMRRIFREQEVAMSLEDAKTWRAAKPEHFQHPNHLPNGFWDSKETAKNMIRAALFDIEGFEAAYRRGDVKTMARLYRKYVIDFPAQDGRQGGQISYWQVKGYAGALLSNSYHYFGNKHGSPRMIVELAFNDVKLIDEKNPDALWPMELEVLDWSDPDVGKKYILNALFQVYGFKAAYRRNDIKRMAELYTKHIINYTPEDAERFANGGQLIYFLEKGRLGGLMARKRDYLFRKSNSPASLLRFAIPGLIDATNPVALDPMDVDNGYWMDVGNARTHVFEMLDAITDDELGTFADARARGDFDTMVQLYASTVIPYIAQNPGPQQRGGQTMYFHEVGGLKGLMYWAKPYMKDQPYYSVRDVLQKFFPKFLKALQAAGYQINGADEAILVQGRAKNPLIATSVASVVRHLLQNGIQPEAYFKENIHIRDLYRLMERLGFLVQAGYNNFVWAPRLRSIPAEELLEVVDSAKVLKRIPGLIDQQDLRDIRAWVTETFPLEDAAILALDADFSQEFVYQLTEDDLLPGDSTWKEQYQVLLTKAAGGIYRAGERLGRQLNQGDLSFFVLSLVDDLDYLVANSVDAIMERFGDDYLKGEIRFKMFVRDGQMWFQLLDNGTGLKGKTLEQIVDPSFTSEKSLDDTFGGAAIGLKVAHYHSKQYGYDLELVDRDDLADGDTGAVLTFRVDLPQSDQALVATNEPETKGGIDLTPDTLQIEIRRDAQGIPQPFTSTELQQIHIDGLIPTIIQIRPATNLPLILGYEEEKVSETSITARL